MHPVSQAWKANQKQLIVDENFVEISVDRADPKALVDAISKDNGSEWFSNTEQIVDRLDKYTQKYVTLESNLWPLDGSGVLLPDNIFDVIDPGFVSKTICDDNALFQTIPVIEVIFSTTHDNPIPGIMITWAQAYGEYAVDFTVTAYIDALIIAQSNVSDNDNIVSSVKMPITKYNRITIEINKWCLPHRRARIIELFVGLRTIYTKSNLMSFTQNAIASPLSASLPKYSLVYEIDNIDNEYDFNNPSGLTGYLLERQEINVRYGYKFNGVIEWISGGRYYLSEWDLPQNGITVRFTARDILEFMSDMFHKGIYAPNGVSLYSLAEQVLIDAKLPLNADGEVNWIIDESLKNIFTTAPLPMQKHAECLQLIANAACCSMSFDRTGRLRIEPVSIVTSFAGTATASDNGSVWFSQTNQITNEQDADFVQYVTLETNSWLLNGSFYSLPDMASELYPTGFVSKSFSADDCRFDDKPIVTLQFMRIQRALLTQISITWSTTHKEYAADFDVIAYRDNEAIGNFNFYGNDNIISIVPIEIQDYDRISIQINKWCLPHRRARIESVPPEIDYEISLFNSFSKSEIEVMKPLAGVDVQAYKYFTETETRELFDGDLFVNGTKTFIISYSQAAVSVAATVSDGTLISFVYYTYACELTIMANAEAHVNVIGIPLETSAITISTDTGISGERQTVENKLITSSAHAQNVGEWTQDYLINRTILTSEWRADPRLDPLDIVLNQNIYDFQPVRMTEVEYSYNGAFRGRGKGRALFG